MGGFSEAIALINAILWHEYVLYVIVGTGIILFASIPITLMFGYQAMRAYKDDGARLKSVRIGPDHPTPSIEDLLTGRDIERR